MPEEIYRLYKRDWSQNPSPWILVKEYTSLSYTDGLLFDIEELLASNEDIKVEVEVNPR